MVRLLQATLLAAALLGCGGLDPAQLRLVVDADRDGRVDPAATSADSAGRAAASAVLLANLDDDDGDGVIDAEDERLSGQADADDLARLVLAPIPDLPDGAVGRVIPDAASAARLRVFRRLPDGLWTVLGADVLLAAGDLRTGIELGVEARDLAGPTWDGVVRIAVEIVDADGQPIGRDLAALRVAPLLFPSSLAPVDMLFATAFGGDPDSESFIRTLTAGAGPIEFRKLDGNAGRYAGDQWTQDLFEAGWTEMPSPTGVSRILLFLRTPTPDRPAARFVEELLGPGRGWLWRRSDPYRRTFDEESLDSLGNLEVIPGHGAFPLGRLLLGSTDRRQMDPALVGFLDAQGPQAPAFRMDTSWLLVGHVDEVVAFVPAPTPRGWKMLLASPEAARRLLVDAAARKPDAVLFRGVKWYDWSSDVETPAEIGVAALLGKADLMAANQDAQARIDDIRRALQAATGLADEEIIDVPVLFEPIAEGGIVEHVAYTTNTINLAHVGDTLFPAEPHGPIIDGGDAFKADFARRLAPLGLTVAWTEDWNLYHRMAGEVHCGTNAARRPPETPRWWEVPR